MLEIFVEIIISWFDTNDKIHEKWYVTNNNETIVKTRLIYLCWLSVWFILGPSWSWSYRMWIYNYLCNLCLSPLMLWVRIPIMARCTTLWDKVCQWLVTGWQFSPCPPVSSTNKTDHHDITEILLKVALNTIYQT